MNYSSFISYVSIVIIMIVCVYITFITTNTPKTKKIITEVFDTSRETFTMCLFIDPNYQLNDLNAMVAEWIRYYKYLGADEFICCYNASINKFDKTINEFTFVESKNQLEFYNKCVGHCKTKWMMCFDLDEFFVFDERIKSKDSLKYFLHEHRNHDILYIKWRIIGHNGLTNFKSNVDIVKQYTDMTCKNFKNIEIPSKDKNGKYKKWGANNITKWIGKTRALKRMDKLSSHHVLNFDQNLNILQKVIDWDIARLNHYYILSKNMLALPSTRCKTFINEKLIDNKCIIGDSSMSLREFIQNKIENSKNCKDYTLSKLSF